MSESWGKIAFEQAPLQIIDGDRGTKYPQKDDFTDSGYCVFLNTSNVLSDGFNLFQCQFISESKDQELRKGRLCRGDVVLTTRGTIGNIGIYDESVPYDHIRINSGMVILRTDKGKLLPAFLFQFLRSSFFREQVDSLRSGAAQPQLPIRDIKRVLIPFPDVPIQTCIVSVLSAYDDLITANQRRIQLLEESARLLYREWFVKLCFPGHETVPISDGVPGGWARKPVSALVDVNPRTPFPRDVARPFVRMEVLAEDSMVIDASSDARPISGGAKFRNGDTLLARITPCLENGKTGFVQFLEDDEAVASGSTEFIVLRSRTVNPYYVYCLARSDSFREHAINSMAGSDGRQRVNTKCFQQYLTLQPPDDVSQHFEDKVRDMFEQVQSLTNYNQALREARDLLLPKLMSGALDVSRITVPQEVAA
ncbi:MAG: restriction endonuclease subunit S [Syntrophobacterales bacterium]|nr:restriction endonuclease subunit S [Syntrophobacterales bacterium]